MLAAPCGLARGLFTFIQLSFCSVFERLSSTSRDAAILRFPGADPMAVGSALVVYITTYVAGVKLLSEPGFEGFQGLKE